MSDSASGWDGPFRAWWDADTEIVRGVWAPRTVCGATEAIASTRTIRALQRGAVPLLVDIRQLKRLDRGAREHYKSDKGGASAMALLVDSAVTRMIANFFMRTDAGETPARMFTEENDAIAWLRSTRQ
jgi:hypothetical protein